MGERAEWRIGPRSVEMAIASRDCNGFRRVPDDEHGARLLLRLREMHQIRRLHKARYRWTKDRKDLRAYMHAWFLMMAQETCRGSRIRARRAEAAWLDWKHTRETEGE